jgi:hypothetical protein
MLCALHALPARLGPGHDRDAAAHAQDCASIEDSLKKYVEVCLL